MTTANIRRVLRRILQPIGPKVCFPEDLPQGELSGERTVIAVSSNAPGKYFASCIATVSLCVPDLSKGVAALSRLGELEKTAVEMFADGVEGDFGDDNYYISLKAHSIEDDAQLRCHYVCLKLLFETLNVMN